VQRGQLARGKPVLKEVREWCASRGGRPKPNVIAYALMSGSAGTAFGALASLTVSGATRVAVWAAVTGATSVASGMAYDSLTVIACWSEVRRWVRGA
jgi:hypothetical protein